MHCAADGRVLAYGEREREGQRRSDAVTAADAGLAGRHDSDVVSRSNQVVIDREAASIVYQVIDNRTSEVVKQFPDDAVLRRRAYFRSLELAKEAPTRLRATDRKA